MNAAPLICNAKDSSLTLAKAGQLIREFIAKSESASQSFQKTNKERKSNVADEVLEKLSVISDLISKEIEEKDGLGSDTPKMKTPTFASKSHASSSRKSTGSHVNGDLAALMKNSTDTAEKSSKKEKKEKKEKKSEKKEKKEKKKDKDSEEKEKKSEKKKGSEKKEKKEKKRGREEAASDESPSKRRSKQVDSD